MPFVDSSAIRFHLITLDHLLAHILVRNEVDFELRQLTAIEEGPTIPVVIGEQERPAACMSRRFAAEIPSSQPVADVGTGLLD